MKVALKNHQHILIYSVSVFIQPELKLINLLNFAQNTQCLKLKTKHASCSELLSNPFHCHCLLCLQTWSHICR